jgi:ATP-dependent exoDNAse (exonuclease V) alpha subunit
MSMTKTQKKRSLKDIRRKAFKLLGEQAISIKDYEAIERICEKNLKKLG